jgi:hypothetical protein
MGRLFDDATPEQEQAFIEERRKFAFLAACQWPLSWLMPARRHKRAADILYDIAYEAHESEMIRHEQEMTRRWAEIKDGLPNGSGSRTLEGQELLNYLNTELLGDYFLLAGYAIECVLKGYLLALLPELVKDEKQLDKLILTHNLCQLCHECAIALSQEEQELLNLITRHIVWAKYAAPIKVEDMPSPEDPEDDKKKSIGIENPFHQRRAQSLVNGVFQRGLDLLNSLRNSQP